MTEQSAPPGTPAPAPAPLRWAVGLLAAQTVALVGIVIFLIIEDLRVKPDNLRTAVGITVYFGIITALLGVVTWSLYRRRRWARSPAVVLEILLMAIGYFMIKGGLAWLGIPVLVLGLVCIALLLNPASRQALGIR